MEDNEKLKALHESLIKDNYELPSYDVFAEDLRNPEKSKAFYDGLVKDNYELPEYEVFVNDLGLKKKVSPADYGLPSKEVFAEMFGNLSKPEVSERPPDEYDEDKFATPDTTLTSPEFSGPKLNSSIGTFPAYRKGVDLSLQSPEFKGPKLETVGETVSAYLSGERITDREYKSEVEKKISELDKEIAALPKDDTEYLPAMNFSGGLILPSRPVSEEKDRLLKQKDELRMAIETPSKLTYILGKAYNQSLIGLADNILNGTPRANEEWLSKYDAGTLTDATATALGFMLDMPFFGGMGKVGAEVGKLAAKPIVDRVMTNSVKKLTAAGIEEKLAKELAIKGATKVSQSIVGMTSSGTALGSYGVVGSALGDWAKPDAHFDDIKWGNALKRGAKDFVLGVSTGGLGIGSSVIASKASAIPNIAGRIGAKAGTSIGGLTAESALFTYGGALLDGRAPKDVSKEEFIDTMALLGILKVSNKAGKVQEAITDPKKAVTNIYKSLQYDPKKPGEGQFSVDIDQWEIEAMGGKDYKSVMDIASKDNKVLADILKSDKVPALLKQKLLWGSRGVAIDNVNFYGDKVVPDGEFVDIYNKEGVLLDKRKYSSKQEADQAILDIGLQLEDNKMQMRSAMSDVDKVKIISELKAKGTDIEKLLIALDKPVKDRSIEESKMVADYASMIPKEKKTEGETTTEEKPEVKPEEPKPEEKPEPESKLAVGEKEFKTKDELNTYLESVAIDKKTGEVDERWFDREVDAWPSPETVKAINEWTENKKAEIKAKKPQPKEEPIEQGVTKVEQKELTKNDLIDEVRRFNILSASGKKKAALQANTIRVNAQRLGYELKEGMDEWKIGITKDGKFLALRKDPVKTDKTKIESQKLLTEYDKDFQDYVSDVFETNPDLFGVMIGGLTNEQRAQAFRDIKAGKKTTASSNALNELERMYKESGGIDIWNAEGKVRVTITRDDIRAEIEDLKRRKRDELFSTYDLDVALEKGLLTKTEYDEIRESERKQDIESRAAEEDFYRSETGDVEGSKEKGTEGTVTPEINEQPVKQPDITTGKEGGDNLQGGTEKDVTAFEATGKTEPSKYTPEQQRQIDVINKEYDPKIADIQRSLDRMDEKARNKVITDAEAEVNRRNSLFGDADAVKDGVLKPGDQGFEVSRKPVDEALRKFDERKVELNKQLAELSKERDSKIGEILKQQTLGFEEAPPVKQTEVKPIPVSEVRPEDKPIVDYLEKAKKVFDEAKDDFSKNMALDNFIYNLAGDARKQFRQKLISYLKGEKVPVTKSGINAIKDEVKKWIDKQAKEPVTEPAKVETPEKKVEIPQGIKFKDKNYTDIEQVQDDLAEGKITFEESKTLMEDVRKLESPPEKKAKERRKSMKKVGAEPLTDKPEELAWDQPLPISTREDPNFKHSDLNNAMSLRNVGRNLIRNVGMIEGMDQRTGFIGRFAKKARGLFNPRSGIIRVKGPKDIRALAHEIGHWIDHEIFDIRGIISAMPPNKQLGNGVDFNGATYTNVKEVEQAIKDYSITIAEGNQLLPLVRKFESLKSKEKYSEIITQTVTQGVQFKNKSYKSVKEINDAVASGVMPQAKGTELVRKFNNRNKGLSKRIDALNAKYGEDVVAGVMQRNVLKKEFDTLLKDIGYPSKKRTEGIAEFIYNYIIDPKQLVNSTPNALVWFEKLLDNAPEIKRAMQLAREDFAKYDAQDIRTKLEAEQKTPEKEKTPFLEGITKIADEFYYSVVNHLAPLKGTVDEWKKIVGDTYLPYKDPFLSAKAMIGIDGRAKVWLTHNPYFNRGDEIIFKKDVDGLLNIIKPIINTPNYDSYKTYLLVLDSIESHAKGKPEQAYYGKEEANAARLAYEKEFGVAKLWEFRDKIQKYNHALLDFYVESGRISKETADYWKKEHENYVPLKRISEEYEKLKGEKAITRDLLPESERAIFSRKGSEKQVKDIFESMIENTYHILASGERNILNKNVADMLFDIHNYNRENKKGAVIEEIDAREVKAIIDPVTGELRYALVKERPANFKKPKGHILSVYEDGKPKFYDIAPEYYDSIFKTIIPQSMAAGKIMKILSLPSRWLQAGSVVYDPTFPVRNIARDQISSLFYSKHGYHPGWFGRGIVDLFKKNDYYYKWLASGADQSFLVSADKMISEDYMSKKIGNLTRRKFDTYKRNPLMLLQDFSMATEIGTRIGGFENAYKKTGSVRLAMQESRDIAADYGIKGAGVKSILPLYPFLNARTQHARMTIGSFRNNPIPTMLKGVGFVTIPTLLNWLNNNKDEEAQMLYQGLPTWRKLSMFNIRIPGTDHFFPIPKGFFGTMFGSSVESILDNVVKDDPRALDKLLPELFQSVSPVGNWSEFIPLIGRPMLEDAVNQKGYTGKPIISESLKMLPKSQQFYNSTPEIIKKMGEALNWSPVRIEHYIKSYTGGAGFGAINILDETLQATGVVDKKPEDTFTALSRLPLLKAILTERPVGLYSGQISDFYETMDKIEKTVFTVNNYIKKGDADGADKFLADKENSRMYSFYLGNSTAINSFRQSLSWVRDAGYAVMKDDLLTMREKQDEVRRMNDIIHETTLQFKDAYDKNEYFNYSKSMDEIVDRMKEKRKEQRSIVGDQKLIYNPYWIQLKDKNREAYDLLKEFGGLREIEQTRKYTSMSGEKLDLDIDDVRRFNEDVVKNYGKLVKQSLGNDRKSWESMKEAMGTKEDRSMLDDQLEGLWEQAMAITKGTFVPMNQTK